MTSPHDESTAESESLGLRRFVAVGHCGPDMGMLRTALRRAVAGATLLEATDEASLASHRDGDAVWLINRMLDGDFTAADGIDLIAREAKLGHGAVLLLVSNLFDAQAAARAAGGTPGFGKSGLFRPETAEVLRKVAHRAAPPSRDA